MRKSGKPQSLLLPTLYPSKEELELGDAAKDSFLKLHTSFGLELGPDSDENYYSYIQATASHYIRLKRLADYPAAKHYRARAEAISKFANDLIHEIEKEPVEELWWISFEISKKLKLPLQTNIFSTELSVTSIIQQLAAISHDFAKIVREHPGIKEAQELEYLVRQLAQLWVLVTGKKFPKSLQLHGNGEFISPATHFVHVMARAFDPAVTAAQIRTVLKRIPPEALSVQ